MKTRLRKWGNSLGVVVPAGNLDDIKEGDEITITLRKTKKDNVIEKTFGILKDWEKPTDKIMKEIDEELWED